MADSVTTTPTPAVVTAGWKTTEFWATVAGALVTILNKAFNWNLPPDAIISIVGGIAAYVISRAVVKAAAPSSSTSSATTTTGG